jgi:pimeloyl-ACP methyl ester carboxylesterase
MSPTDVVVVVPGIMGSTLSHNGVPVWAPSAGALIDGIRTLGGNLKQLQLPDGIGDEHPGDGVQAMGLMPDVHVIPGVWSPIRGYSVLLKRLNGLCATGKVGKVVPFPYDWRLSNRHNANRLKTVIADELGGWRESDPSRTDARVVFVCHSMGGLLARWFIEKCGGAELTRKIITLGTPYRGAARTIDQLVNGVRKGFGPVGVDLSAFARSMPSSHQLLPDYACINKSGDLFRLDETTVPGLDSTMLTDGLKFHRDLDDAETARGTASVDITHAIVGINQPTATTVTVTNRGVEVLQTIGSENDYGDATVPLVAAIGHGLPMDTSRVRRINDHHGSLQVNDAAWDEVESIITTEPIRRRAGQPMSVRLDAPELVLLGEDIAVGVDFIEPAADAIPAVEVTLSAERAPGSARVAPLVRTPRVRDLHLATTFTPTEPGTYRLDITGTRPGAIQPVTASVLVWPSDDAG